MMHETLLRKRFTVLSFCGLSHKSTKVSSGRTTMRFVRLLEFLIFSVSNVSRSIPSNSYVLTTQTKLSSSNSTNSSSNWNKKSTRLRVSSGHSFHSPITKTVWILFNRRRQVFWPCWMMSAVFQEVPTGTFASVCSISGSQKKGKLFLRTREFTPRKSSKVNPSFASGISLVWWSTMPLQASWRRIRTKSLLPHKIFSRLLLLI
mmetsp:Transcript_12666/g.31891  ORF Transcript_12666/g.31891 Transcript_12666/m.31891 type:complete len:204 (-) Transcript_12666:3788-4399(-)